MSKLKICFCKNYFSYKKLLPTLELHPNDIIVTADDDVLYEKDWLQSLYYSYLNNNECIHCTRAKILPSQMLLSKNIEYGALKDCSFKEHNNVSFYILPLGYGGILYPPCSLSKDVLNFDNANKICPHADDIWFWGNALKQETKFCFVFGVKLKMLFYFNCLNSNNLFLNGKYIKNIINNFVSLGKVIC